jgi:hypothetical protein
MIRLTNRELAKALGVSESYSRKLLHEKGIRLRHEDWEKIVELIVERRRKPINTE